jgi:hypothetical protein
MLAHSSVKPAARGLFLTWLAIVVFLAVPARGQAPPSQSETPPATDSRPANAPTSQQPPTSNSQSTAPPASRQPPKTDSGSTAPASQQQPISSRSTAPPASQQPPPKGGHPVETTPGRTPHSSNDGPAIGAAIGAAAAGVIIGELMAHHNASPEKLGHDGPQVPKEFDMSGFIVKGLVRPSWPVVLDFMVDSPGSVEVDIIVDKQEFRATMTNTPNRRGYVIIRLPANFGTKLATGIYQIRAIPVAGANTPAPRLRTYGLGAGEKAVGSVAIDQLTFQPATIHPKANEVADYGFHAHSAFDGVRAEFIFTTLYNGRMLVQKDQEETLSPIPEGERAKGTWKGQGKPGEHMLQIRAWRGLENGGDWVVAWSPDIVDVVK